MPVHNHFVVDPQTRLPSGPALAEHGPRLQVEISLHPTLVQHLQTQGQAVPAPVIGAALIDTGATISAVDTTLVVQPLQIQPIGSVQVGTAGGPQTQHQYPASFGFPGTRLPGINFNFVIGCNLTGQGIIALIGRDVLRHFVMVYNGVLGQVILSL